MSKRNEYFNDFLSGLFDGIFGDLIDPEKPTSQSPTPTTKLQDQLLQSQNTVSTLRAEILEQNAREVRLRKSIKLNRKRNTELSDSVQQLGNELGNYIYVMETYFPNAKENTPEVLTELLQAMKLEQETDKSIVDTNSVIELSNALANIFSQKNEMYNMSVTRLSEYVRSFLYTMEYVTGNCAKDK